MCLVGLVLALPGIAAPVAADQSSPGNAEQAFTAIYEREWAWRNAELLTDNDTATEGVRPALPRADARSEAARLDYWRSVLKQLDAIQPARLSPRSQLDYAVYREQIEVLAADEQFHDYEMPANSDSSFWGDTESVAEDSFKTEADYRNFIRQMEDVPRFFTEETSVMRAGLARGFTPPKVTLMGRDKSIGLVADAATPEATGYYKPFKEMPASIPLATQEALRAQARQVIAAQVQPAYRTLLKFFRDTYVTQARTTLAAEALPDGKAYYQAKIREFTTTDLTPEAIHALGLKEVADIRAQMTATIGQAHFQGDIPAFLKFLRTDPQFYVKTPDELLMRAAFIAKEFDGKADQYFGLLPRRRFAIKPVPPEEAPFYTAGRGGPGVFLLNTYDLASRPLYSLTALTLHESAPGHAFQIPLAEEQKDLPAFRRKTYISAFGEGWAVYCERLGSEMGMYHTPYETFGMLSYQAWRAARLVVDTGIHAQGWTREQAQQYLRDNTALSDHEIETEVDRYISWPGQALSYYLGEIAIRDGRAKAETALGDRFNIRAFHDAVLELGSVPLPVLSARIDRLIAEGGKGPYPDVER